LKTYLRILSYAKPYGKFFPIYSLLIFLHVLFDLISFTLLIPLLDIIFEQKNTSLFSNENIGFAFIDQVKNYINNSFLHVIASHGKVGALAYVCLSMLIANFFTNLFYYSSQRHIASTRSKMIYRLRQALYQKICGLDIVFFSNEKRGDLISRITNDIQEIERSIVGSLRVVFRDPFKVIIIFVYLLLQDTKLTLFCLGIMPLAALSISFISKKLRKLADKSQAVLSEIVEVVNETIGGIRIVRAFSKSTFLQDKFDQSNNRYGNVLKQMAYKRDLASPLSQFVSVSFVMSILFYGGYLVLTDTTAQLSPAEFLTFIIIFARILDPAKAIAAAISDIQRGLIAGVRVFDILDQKQNITEAAKPRKIQLIQKEIRFENLSFAYHKTLVLDQVNFSIQKGQTVALVGASGAGKSTLMDMIPRFYDPKKGRICIDGTDIKLFSIADLHSLMGIVTQESILFHDTIFNNIAFGIACSKEEVIQAAKIANAHEFIEHMDEGYATIVGDRGLKLSGGQKQRITIARAILKNPQLLLLDEATSALDTASEALVQGALDNLMKNRTSLVIAHRLSTIQQADLIIVLENGKVVEQGTHQSLMQQEGVYKSLSKRTR